MKFPFRDIEQFTERRTSFLAWMVKPFVGRQALYFP